MFLRRGFWSRDIANLNLARSRPEPHFTFPRRALGLVLEIGKPVGAVVSSSSHPVDYDRDPGVLLALKAQSVRRPAPLAQPQGDVSCVGGFRNGEARADAPSRILDKHTATTLRHLATRTLNERARERCQAPATEELSNLNKGRRWVGTGDLPRM
jgi:hypothetical protein